MYCLAFAEQAHGSDLSGVETRGEVLGNHVFVSGLKTWVAGADRADGALVLCRTAPQELSCVLVPLPHHSVDRYPIQVLSGDNLFELRFDGAQISLDDLVGGRGRGLEVAMRELQRVQDADLEREFWELVETVRQYGRNRDPLVRQELAWAYSQVRIIHSLTERQPSLADLIAREYHRRLGEIAIDVTGSDGLLREDAEAYAGTRWQRLFLVSRGDTIANRTSEVQRDRIAEQQLGLPR